jgi:hypothetical protein
VRYTIQIVLVVLLVLGFVYRDKVADYWHQFRARIENPSKPPEDPGATPPATEPPPVK